MPSAPIATVNRPPPSYPPRERLQMSSSDALPTNPFRRATASIEARWRPVIERMGIPSLGSSEAQLLATLAAANGARRALELGTAIGYSAAYLATAMGPSGRVTAVELDPERAAVARRLWLEAGLADRVTLHQSDALG